LSSGIWGQVGQHSETLFPKKRRHSKSIKISRINPTAIFISEFSLLIVPKIFLTPSHLLLCVYSRHIYLHGVHIHPKWEFTFTPSGKQAGKLKEYRRA
jgi:hypothetical protein